MLIAGLGPDRNDLEGGSLRIKRGVDMAKEKATPPRNRAKLKPPMLASRTDIWSMSHDNVEVGDFSIMSDGLTVYLSEQRTGHPSQQEFQIDRPTFNKLIRWYVTGKVPKEDKR
jgi:hypothetical protein